MAPFIKIFKKNKHRKETTSLQEWKGIEFMNEMYFQMRKARCGDVKQKMLWSLHIHKISCIMYMWVMRKDARYGRIWLCWLLWWRKEGRRWVKTTVTTNPYVLTRSVKRSCHNLPNLLSTRVKDNESEGTLKGR